MPSLTWENHIFSLQLKESRFNQDQTVLKQDIMNRHVIWVLFMAMIR